jgi:hypothetical protein
MQIHKRSWEKRHFSLGPADFDDDSRGSISHLKQAFGIDTVIFQDSTLNSCM